MDNTESEVSDVNTRGMWCWKRKVLLMIVMAILFSACATRAMTITGEIVSKSYSPAHEETRNTGYGVCGIGMDGKYSCAPGMKALKIPADHVQVPARYYMVIATTQCENEVIAEVPEAVYFEYQEGHTITLEGVFLCK